MSLIWGVDSSHIHADVVVNRYGGRRGWPTRAQGNYQRATAAESQAGDAYTFYDWLSDQAGREPRFWGRYINNITPRAVEQARDLRRQARRLPRAEREAQWGVASHRWLAGRAATRVSESEIRFIHERSNGQCKVLLVFNNIEERSCGQEREAGFQRGWADAFNAVFAARELGAPAGVRIYGDVENWNVSGEWLWGWCDYMERCEYAGMGGLYGRGRELRVPAGQTYRQYDRSHRRHLRRTLALPQARDQYPDAAVGSALRTAGPMRGPSAIPALRGLAPARNPARRRRLPPLNRGLYFWSNMPRAGCSLRLAADSNFLGLGPSGARTVVWQYGLNCYDERLDLNVAIEAGFADMWSRSSR